MLQIQKIYKKYVTGDLEQTALDGVSLNLRDNEFVAILGPSGSGKTTLLNVIGGLDRYDSGDLIINGISTKKYKDRDWDSYRNHTIGFVFQSYNLIPHQTVLSNVELALTISGISKSERKKRATEALEKVGLGKQLHKKPNQMSGGQMQRVAIARALVNDPKILLADEPTGALDSETSIQVMDLLKEVAKDRLVVMVTHNPELAEQYANRIVRVKDGHIVDDSNPYELDTKNMAPPKHENMGKASMSLLTALSLSFNNLKTKKGRTLLTSFAGSIGIIGIALILSLSNGVNTYIDNIQKETMTSYPISIESETIDLSSIMSSDGPTAGQVTDADHDLDAVYSNGSSLEMASTMTSSFTENNLTAFKKYLDNPDSEINKYVGENGIIYSYDTKFDVYTKDQDGTLVNTNGSTLTDNNNSTNTMLGMSNMSTMSNMPGLPGMTSSSNNFSELLPGKDGESVSEAIKESYDLLYGNWPNAYDEIILTLDKNNEISSNTLYQLGILPSSEYKELMKKIEYLESILADEQLLLGVIKDEILEIKKKYSDARRTEIRHAEGEIDIKDLIDDEEITITLTHFGYIKRLPLDTYKSQRRGGRGISALTVREEDFVKHLITTRTHNRLLFFTNRGRVFRLDAFEVPEGKRQAKGTAIVNLLQLGPNEKIATLIEVDGRADDDSYLLLATKKGIVKKTKRSEFKNINKSGLIAIGLRDDDELIDVKTTNGEKDVLLVTSNGMSIRFDEKDIRPMGRTAMGVKGITLSEGDKVVSMSLSDEGEDLLVVSQNGYGKRTDINEYRSQIRAGKGIKTYNMSEKTGEIVGATMVNNEDELMLINSDGVLIRLRVDDISVFGRITSGVKLMKTDDEVNVVSIAKIDTEEE